MQGTAKCLAEQLEKEADRPTVFWLEFEGDNNYSNRHPLFSNQYWITIKHQEEQSEYERLILSGLYRSVLDRKRLLWAMPKADYSKKIVSEYSIECRKSAYNMIAEINAFVTTIDAELYLKPRGFQTSRATHEKLLKARIDEYGDLNIPKSYVCEDGYRLGVWLRTVRSNYQNGELSERRIQALEKLGIIWNPMQEAWEIGYAHAKAYFEEYRKLPPAKYICEAGYNLGQWVQRQKQRLKSGKADGNTVRLLNEVGITI